MSQEIKDGPTDKIHSKTIFWISGPNKTQKKPTTKFLGNRKNGFLVLMT